MSRNKKPLQQGEWLFLSALVSVTAGFILGASQGIGYGILAFLLTALFCWLHYLSRK